MNQSKPSMIGPALIGAVFLGVASGFPIIGYANCACCIWVIGGGLIAAFFYQRAWPPGLPAINFGDAAVLGLLTGFLGGLIWTVVGVSLMYLQLRLGIGMADMEEVVRALESADLPPQVQDFLIALITSGTAMSGWMVVGQAFINVFLALIFATLGAIIGFALFKKPAAAPIAPAGPMTPPPAPPG